MGGVGGRSGSDCERMLPKTVRLRYVLIDDSDQGQGHRHAGAAGRRAAPTRRSGDHQVRVLLGAQRGGSSPRWPATGRTCSRYCAQSELNRGPAGCVARSSSSRGAGGPPARRRLQQIDTSALPVKHASRVRGPDGWTGPNGLHARFGRDAAHASGSTVSAWRPRPTWAAASCGPGASCPPPSASVTWAPTCRSRAAAPRPARGQGVQRQGVRRVPGRQRHRVLVPPTKDQRKTKQAISKRSTPSEATATRKQKRRSKKR